MTTRNDIVTKIRTRTSRTRGCSAYHGISLLGRIIVLEGKDITDYYMTFISLVGMYGPAATVSRMSPCSDITWEFLFCFVSDESGCEADMAEGGQDEDSGGVMLATVTTPTTASSGAAIKRDPDAPLTLKSEVSWPAESSTCCRCFV